jgi:hypothetical protein
MAAKTKETKRKFSFGGALDQIGRAQLLYTFAAYGLPILASSTAVVAGLLEREPVMWIITAAVLILFAGVGAFYHLISVMQFITPMGKLRYSNTMVACDLANIRPGRTKAISQAVIHHRHIEKMQVGVYLLNAAHFDMSAFIEEANTSMDGKTPPRATYPKPAVIIRPGQVVFMLDDAIDMQGRACSNITGRLEMTIKYGTPGREKYDLQFRGSIEVHMRNTGLMTSHYTIWDAESGVTAHS